MKKVKTYKLKKRLKGRMCYWCNKEKDDFYGDMCTDCMSQ